MIFIILLYFSDYSGWYISTSSDPVGECPAVEVIQYKNPRGLFATSPKPRLKRPSEVRWRVGQVIRNARLGYKGVIIGWDEYSKVILEILLIL